MPLGFFHKKPATDELLTTIIEQNERQLRAIEGMVQAFAQASLEQSKVINTLLGMYATPEPPTTRLNGDQYQLSLSEQHRLAMHGYPTHGSEREQLEWMLLHPDIAQGYTPLDR